MSRHCALAYAAAVEALRAQTQAMLDQVEPLREENPDAVHDMRVASRRVRAVISEHGKLFAKQAIVPLRAHARHITSALGRPRELDVSIALLQAQGKGFHGPARFAANHVLRTLRILRGMESDSVRQVAALVGSPEFHLEVQTAVNSFGKPDRCLLKAAIAGTTKRFKDVVETYGQWQESGAGDRLHRLRIEFKKLRYTCEIYRNTYGHEMEGFIRALKDVQEWLGEWHDYSVLRNYAGQTAAAAPPKAAQGMPELLRALDTELAKLLTGFTTHAEQFLEVSRRESLAGFLSSLRHECCWTGGKSP